MRFIAMIGQVSSKIEVVLGRSKSDKFKTERAALGDADCSKTHSVQVVNCMDQALTTLWLVAAVARSVVYTLWDSLN
jgi:hypothetical protein